MMASFALTEPDSGSDAASLTTKDERDATVWMDKHIADFQRGFELANLDITQPVTRRDENGDVRPFR